MPGLITAASVVATGVTMVGLDAAEYVAFSLIGKQLKNNKGANKNMMTANDFIKAAKAKKAAGLTATVNIVEKAKEVAITAKEAVMGAMPASNKSVDRIAEVTAVLVASLEQRIDYLEEQIGSSVQVDTEALTERVSQILGSLHPTKAKKETPAPKPSEVGAKVSKETLAATPSAQTAVTGKRPRLGGQYETPQDWSDVPSHN